MNETSTSSELTFQLIVESAPNAMVLINKEGVIILVNKKAEELFGYTRQELVGASIETLIPDRFHGHHPGHRDIFFIRPAIRPMGAGRELFARRKDGSEFPVEIGLNPIETKEGLVVLASVIDISERKKFEEQQSLFTSIINSSDDAILSKNLEGEILSWNYGAEKVFGYNEKEIVGKHISILIPHHLRDEENEIIMRIRNGNSIDHYETERIKKDGQLINVSLTISPIKDSAGKIIGASKISRDITDQKKSQEAIAKSEAHYRMLMEQAADGIFVSDGQGMYIDVNIAGCNMMGYSREELLGLNVTDLLMDDELPRLESQIGQLQNGGMVVSEWKFKRKDGSWFPGELIGRVLPDGSMQGILRDISDRKKAEEKIIKTNRLYAYLSAINQSIVHIKDQQELLDNACNIAIQIGQFRLAWIGIVEDNGRINMVSIYGDEAGVEIIRQFTGADYNDPTFRDTVTGRALRTGKYVINNDVQSDPAYSQWKDYFMQQGICSGICLPICKSGRASLFFSLQAGTKDFFDEDEIKLLEEVAGDISFALDNLEKEKDRLAAREKLIREDIKLKQAQAVAHVGSWELDFATGIAIWSEEACRIFGVPIEDNIQSAKAFYDLTHPEDLSTLMKVVNESNATHTDSNVDNRIVLKDGTVKYIHTERRFEFDKDGKAKGLYGITQDVTEQKLAEEKILKATRLYAFISSVNKSIVYLDNEKTLLDNICQIALEVGGFKMAWAGMLDANNKLNIVSVAGDEEGILRTRKYSGVDRDDPLLENIPTGKVLRTGKYAFNNDMQSDPAYVIWKSEFEMQGINSSIGLPIFRFGEVVGVFSLQSGKKDFFDRDEIALVEEAADNISFALENLEREKQRVLATALVVQNEARLNKAQSIAHIGHWELDFSTGIAEWSQESCRIYGLAPTDNKHTYEAWSSFIHPDDADYVMDVIKQQQESLSDASFGHRIIRKDGSVRYIHAESTFLYNETGQLRGLYGISHDITEAKLLEEELRKSETNLRTIFDNTDVGFLLMDIDYNVVASNVTIQKWAKMSFGEELERGENLINKLKPAFLVEYYQMMKMLKERGQFINEAFYPDMGGGDKWYLVSGKYVIDDTGKSIGICLAVTDITEKKAAEQQIEFDKNNLDALINNTTDLMWSVDRDYKLITYNDPMEDAIYHATGKSLVKGVDILSFGLSKEQSQMYKGFYDRAFAGEVFTEVEYHRAPIDAWSELSFYPIMKGEEIIGSACHSRDITERKKTEIEIQQLNEKLKDANTELLTILNTLPANIALLDEKGVIIAVDEAWKKFADENNMQSDNYGVGDNYLDVCQKATGAEMHDALEMASGVSKVLNGHEQKFAMEYPCHSPLEQRWFRVEVRPLVENERSGAVVMHINITERKEAENKIVQLNESLEVRVQERTAELSEANKALEAFSYSVSHDLQAPIRTMAGFTKIIKQEYAAQLDPELNKLLGFIDSGSKRMSELIDDLLKLAKYDKEGLRLVTVNMNELINGTWANISRSNPNHAVLELAEMPEVQADSSLIQQVVINLLTNAVKYSSKKEKPIVSVWAEQTKENTTFYFKDNGAGFDMAMHQRLFGAFNRLHGVSEFEGTGIGLTLVKRIIEKHGGTVDGEGKVGEGATFYFTLPNR